jgi:hypothetical protein
MPAAAAGDTGAACKALPRHAQAIPEARLSGD